MFDLFLLVVEWLGIVFVDCVVIEDSLVGIFVVKVVGMCVVGFLGGSYVVFVGLV